MLDGLYKRVLDKMPEGVFVFDSKLRVKFTNAAFRRSFPVQKQRAATLSATLGCREEGACGENASCVYCAFYKAMRAAIEQNAEQTEILHTTVQRDGRMDKLSVRIHVLPLDKKGKLFELDLWRVDFNPLKTLPLAESAYY